MSGPQTFLSRLRDGHICVGSTVSFSDPTVTEALGGAGLDFVWIDAEHSPLNIEVVQAHVMAAELVGVSSLVRVPWNDAVAIKRALDVGASGVIVPMIRSAEEARQAIAACRYPPVGVRGFGPRRPSRYGRESGREFCTVSDANVVTIIQIEHTEAVRNLGEILDVPGVEAVLIGANDLAASMGFPGEPENHQVKRMVGQVIQAGVDRGLFVGIPVGDDVAAIRTFVERGVRWLALGSDTLFLTGGIDRLATATRRVIAAVQAREV